MGRSGVEKCPRGVRGADAEVGALVWVRRRNGSWWPGRILDQDELPDNCVIPPHSTGTPIKLLGRPDGSIDWYNLEKSKRVKAFRCGEYEECIDKAKTLAGLQTRTYIEGKYVRREDAIMHALEIERSRFTDEDEMNNAVSASQNSYSAKSKNINGLNKRFSCTERILYDVEEKSAQGLSEALTLFKQPQNIPSSSTRYSLSSKKKRKATKDFEDDTVQGSRCMRDLWEIGSNKVPKQKSSVGIFSNGHQDPPLLESGPSFGYALSGTNGIKKSKRSHSSTKRKRSNIGQAYENLRKKDRRRPLSKLCEDSAVAVPTYCLWDLSGQSSVQYPGHKLSNVFEPIRGKSAFSMDVNDCSYNSGTSSVETLVDASWTNRNGAAKVIQVKDAEVSCMTGFLNDDCTDDDEFFDAPRNVEGDVLEEGNLQMHGSFAYLKDQVSEPKNQTTDYNKERIPSIHDHRSFKKKSISSVNWVTQESHSRDKNLLVQQYERIIKCQALDRDVVGLDVRVGNASFCKRNELENNMQLTIVPADGCAGVVGQQYYESGPEHDKSSKTISNHSHSGHRVPLVSLVSKWSGKPIVGYPVSVEVLDDSHPAASRDDNRPAIVGYPVPVEVLDDSHPAASRDDNRPAIVGYPVPVEVLDDSRPAASRDDHRPAIVGYPLPVEVLDDSCSAASTDDHRPAISSLNHLLKGSKVAEPRQARSSHASRSKPSGRKKISEHDIDKSWRPHTKKSASSPRKMRRLSSFSSNHRKCVNRKPVVARIGGPTIVCTPLRHVQ